MTVGKTMKKLLMYIVIWPGEYILSQEENLMPYNKQVTHRDKRTILSPVTYRGFLEMCKIHKDLRKIIR